MTDLHPVKQETFDISDRINVDPKGFYRQVDTFKLTDFGLYMARGANHPKFGYLESWMLPQLGLRANIFHFRPGYEQPQDFYLDVVDIRVEDSSWFTRDLYVDLVSLTGEPVSVLDIDELASATSEGLISADDAEKAIETTLNAVEGITRFGDDVNAWLQSQGIDLTWKNPSLIELAPSE